MMETAFVKISSDEWLKQQKASDKCWQQESMSYVSYNKLAVNITVANLLYEYCMSVISKL